MIDAHFVNDLITFVDCDASVLVGTRRTTDNACGRGCFSSICKALRAYAPVFPGIIKRIRF